MATTTIRLPDDLKQQATACADSLGISLNAVMNIALDSYLYQRQYRMAQVTQPAEAKNREPASPPPVQSQNSPCACGSGKKYKRCCGA